MIREKRGAARLLRRTSMKREEVLQKLGFSIPKEKRIRVIVHSDLKNEADD